MVHVYPPNRLNCQQLLLLCAMAQWCVLLLSQSSHANSPAHTMRMPATATRHHAKPLKNPRIHDMCGDMLPAGTLCADKHTPCSLRRDSSRSCCIQAIPVCLQPFLLHSRILVSQRARRPDGAF